MARKKQGKGCVPSGLMAYTQGVADDLYTKCDALIIVAVKFAGASDNDENVVRIARGSKVVLRGLLDKIYDHDDSEVLVELDDQIIEDDD